MIHRFWMGPAREGVDHRADLERLHPAELVYDWTPETVPADLVPMISRGVDPRRVSNLIRLALLLRFGGLWVDHDVRPLVPLTTSPTPWTASLHGLREGCVLWFPRPGHAMLRSALREQEARPHLLGATVLRVVGADHLDVDHEHGVIDGPLAVHGWDTSRTYREAV